MATPAMLNVSSEMGAKRTAELPSHEGIFVCLLGVLKKTLGSGIGRV